jgi:hypothetical protein
MQRGSTGGPIDKAKKGKKKGRLWLDIVIKNTGNEPQNFAIFGQGKTKSGETTVKVRTRYKGTTPPKEILVEIFPSL